MMADRDLVEASAQVDQVGRRQAVAVQANTLQSQAKHVVLGTPKKKKRKIQMCAGRRGHLRLPVLCTPPCYLVWVHVRTTRRDHSAQMQKSSCSKWIQVGNSRRTRDEVGTHGVAFDGCKHKRRAWFRGGFIAHLDNRPKPRKSSRKEIAESKGVEKVCTPNGRFFDRGKSFPNFLRRPCDLEPGRQWTGDE